jgi:hypothetical protein
LSADDLGGAAPPAGCWTEAAYTITRKRKAVIGIAGAKEDIRMVFMASRGIRVNVDVLQYTHRLRQPYFPLDVQYFS